MKFTVITLHASLTREPSAFCYAIPRFYEFVSIFNLTLFCASATNISMWADSCKPVGFYK